jgi:hypothetical protein
MDAPMFVAIFTPIFSAHALHQGRREQSFSSVSVITGSEILLRVPASSEAANRRIAEYRKSPDSRLLRLND